MIKSNQIRQALAAAIPIMLGYVAIGIPCGIMSDSIGLEAWQALALSLTLYSGAGQFMMSNMWLSGSPLVSIILSIGLINTRQILYSVSLAPYARHVSKRLAFLYAAFVTDESYGVNVSKFEQGNWTVSQATLLSMFSCASWALSNFAGCYAGELLGIPLSIASFAMTSIFICLLFTQKMSVTNIVAMAVAFVSVYFCKLFNIGGLAIIISALLGVFCALIFDTIKEARGAEK